MGSLYLAYMKMGSLTDALESPLEEELCFEYIRQILEGLHYLHEQKIIHRDIKGKNILLENKSSVRLADFGLAKVLEGIDNTADQGTLRWMAPEVFSKNYDFKADIWSVGCTAIEMLTGERPYNDINNNGYLIVKICIEHNHPDIPEYASEKMKDFLKETFEFNACQRKSAGDLLIDFFNQRAQVHTVNQMARGGNAVSESSLSEHINCPKHSSHVLYVSPAKFCGDYLPPNYRDIHMIEFVKNVCDLTVKLDVKMTCRDRPLFWPMSKKEYPFSKMIDKTEIRFATGMVYNVTLYEDKCPCRNCFSSLDPSKGWGVVEVITANHAIFDNFEAKHTTATLFYDDENSHTATLDDFIIVSTDLEKNWCHVKCITCDQAILKKLKEIMESFLTKLNTVCTAQYNLNKTVKKGFLVSHPHGGSKQISIGELIDTTEYGNNWTQFKYTMPTCSGSSGAYVHIVEESGGIWHYPHIHSGSIDAGENYSSIGYRGIPLKEATEAEKEKNKKSSVIANVAAASNETFLLDASLFSCVKNYPGSKKLPEHWTFGDIIYSGKFSSIFHLNDFENTSSKLFVIKKSDLSRKKKVNLENLLQLSLDHERIIPFYMMYEINEKIISILGFMAMGSLVDYYTRNGPLIEDKCLQFTVQILEGLSYLHERNIAHMNIRGKSIFLESENEIRISGFYYWKEGSQPIQSAEYGHVRWAAPEVLNPSWGNPEGSCGILCDIWSMGSTIVEMLTADVPYEYLKQHVEVVLEISKGIPPVPRIKTSNEMTQTLKNFFSAIAKHRLRANVILQRIRNGESFEASPMPVDHSIRSSNDMIENPTINQIKVLIEQLEGLNWRDMDIEYSSKREMKRYKGEESDWGRYIMESKTGYSRSLIHTGPYFEMLLIRLMPLCGNQPHDHGVAQCWFKVLKGNLIEKNFARPVSLGPLSWKYLKLYEINEMNDSPDVGFCHCCSNPSNTEDAVSLVLYYPPIKRCNYYDVDTGRSSIADLDFDSPVHGMHRVSPSSRGLDSVLVQDYYDIYQ